MRHGWTRLAAVAAFVVAAGCKQTPVEESLIGMSEAQIIGKLGQPESRSVDTWPKPDFGPKPHGLEQGTQFTTLVFPRGGENWWVFFVSPEVWRERKGRSPGAEALYAIEIAKIPRGAVF